MEDDRIATFVIRQGDDGETRVSCDFHRDISVGEMFRVTGEAIAGLYAVASKIGESRGMTESQIEDAIKGCAANSKLTGASVEGKTQEAVR